MSSNVTINSGRAPVSVVIPCYRCAATLRRAIESLSEQTVLPEEIILVDDFSNDEGVTARFLTNISQESFNIKIKLLLLDENGGPGTARNEGWKASSQPYLAFLDSDDSWHPQKIEIQYQWMSAHPDVALSGHYWTKLEGDTMYPTLTENVSSRRVGGVPLLFSNNFPTSSIMIKRDVAYRFIPGKRYAEDYLLWLTLVLRGFGAYFLKATLAYTYKEEYGEGGLMADLWQAERGVLNTYRRLYSDGLISFVGLTFFSAISIIKYVRRWGIVKWRLIT